MLGESSLLFFLRMNMLTLDRHYVAFVRKQLPDEQAASWVLFNDEKVAKAADVEEMKKFAYVYFFRRL
jgi:ubiquitin carboxyl-terminal hydrolase 5/13